MILQFTAIQVTTFGMMLQFTKVQHLVCWYDTAAYYNTFGGK